MSFLDDIIIAKAYSPLDNSTKSTCSNSTIWA
jgi:hypothetical protein